MCLEADRVIYTVKAHGDCCNVGLALLVLIGSSVVSVAGFWSRNQCWQLNKVYTCVW